MGEKERSHFTGQIESRNTLPNILIQDETHDNLFSDQQNTNRSGDENTPERGRQLLNLNEFFITSRTSINSQRSESPLPRSRSRSRDSMISDHLNRSRSTSRLRQVISQTDSKKNDEEEDRDIALLSRLADEQDMNLLKADIKSALEGTGSWFKKSTSSTSNPTSNRNSILRLSNVQKGDEIELEELHNIKSKGSSFFDATTVILPTPVNNNQAPKNIEGVYRNLTTRLKSISQSEHRIFGYDEPSNSRDRDTTQPRPLKKQEETESVIELPRPHYQSLMLYGKSLGIFDSFNPFRRGIAEYVRKPSLNRFLRFLLVLQTALLSYRQWNPRKLYNYAEYGRNWVDWALLVVNIIFTIEVLAKIIAWGFWDDSQMHQELAIQYTSIYDLIGIERMKAIFFYNSLNPVDFKLRPSITFPSFSETNKGPIQRAYLRKTWNRLDFVSTVCFWISFFLSFKGDITVNGVPLFRALSCLRILRLTSATSKISLILQTIKNGLPQLMDVMLFILYFWTLFAIIGIQSFKSSFRRFCVWTNPDDPSDTYTSSQQCGGYYEHNSSGDLIKKSYWVDGESNFKSKGFLCPVNSQCLTLKNSYNNMYGFDNILNSMQLTFVIMSGNTFSNIMYSAMDSDSMASAIYFICGIFILLLWMANLLIAVISSSFRTTIERMEGYEETEVLDDFDLTWDFPRNNIVAKYYRKCIVLFDLICLVSVLSLCRRDLDWTEVNSESESKLQRIISFSLLIEIIIRFVAYLPNYKVFFKDYRNRLDLFLALITSTISIPIIQDNLGRGYEWMKAFIIIRFYRDVLLIGFVRKLWAKVWRSISIIANMSFFFFTFLYLSSIIFSSYFEKFASEEDISTMQFPFHTLPNAFIALFAITSTENWSEHMYNMQSIAPSKSTAFISAILFMLWFLLSNFIILNLFIAIIGESLSVSEKEKRKEQVKKFVLVDFPKRLRGIAEGTVLKNLRSKLFGGNNQDERHQEIQNLLLNGVAIEVFLKDELEELAEKNNSESSFDTSSVRELSNSKSRRAIQVHSRRFWKHPLITKIQEVIFWSWKGKRNPFYENRKRGLQGERNYLLLAERYQFESEKIEEERRQYLADNPRFNTSLYILRPTQPLRKLCQKIVKPSTGRRYDGTEPNKIANTVFNAIISSATIAVIILACYNTPLYKKNHMGNTTMWNWTLDAEFSFGLLFLIEFAIKVIADGLIFTPNAYFRNSWNAIDFIVLLSMWTNIIAILKSDEKLSRIVRGFKALRALRLLTLSNTSKDIFHKVMIAGVWKIFGAAFLSFTLLFPFAIWGLNLFSGRLGTCNDGDISNVDCINEYSSTVFEWNILAPRVYTQPQLEFNRFASSLLTLFEVLSLEGWTDLLQNLTSSTGIGTPAQKYASPENGIFMVLFIYVGLIFVLTLFITVIIANYGILSGRAFLTLQQTSWNEVKKLLKQTQPRKRPTKANLGKFKTLCYALTLESNKWINAFLFTILWVHILAILLEKYPSADALDNFRYAIYIISSTVFLIFTTLKMIAIGPEKFFKVSWNIYEVLVFFGAFSTSFASFFIPRNSGFTNINKLFLVGIFTVTIYKSNRLSHLLKIASASIPSLVSLIFTWAILFLVYAIAMNQIFGLTRLGPNTSNNQNLRTVTKALIVLFKNSFGEGWNYTMRDFAVEAPNCISSDEFNLTDCGNMQYAYIFFISWNIVSMFIFVNMFVSLIFESFSYVYTTNAGSATLNREEIRKFKSVWQKFDPNGTGFIPVDKLPAFLAILDGYFAFKVYEGKWSVPGIKKNFIHVLNQKDPYDVDVDIAAINSQLNHLDIFKVNEKKRKYARFIEEAKFNMEFFGEPGISFSRLILQIPLYSRFDENNCLTLTDFLDRLVISRKLTQRIEYRNRLEALAMIVPRWKYLKFRTPKKIIAFYGERNHNHFRKNPFETPDLGGSAESFAPHQILTEDQHY